MSRLVRFSNNPVCQQMEAISLFVRLSVIFFENIPAKCPKSFSLALYKREMKPEEFNHIILPLRQELLSRAFGMTGNGEDAEDLVQEAMLRLWKRRDSLDASDNIKALLYTILRNAFYDDRRRQQRHPSAELSEGVAGFEERGVETLDEMALIRNIVEHLPPLQRQLFRMKEIEGYDAGEIMQITGCTADNLRKNLSRARLKIRDTYMKLMKGARDEK